MNETDSSEGLPEAETTPAAPHSNPAIAAMQSMDRKAVGAGRKSGYSRAICKTAKRLARAGMADWEISKLLGVSVRTLYRWQAEHKEFRQALSTDSDEADTRVQRALYQRAIGWVGPTEKVLRNGTIVKHKQFHAPDTTAAMNWLTNRRPDKWKRNLEESQGLGITVNISSPIMIAALAGSPPEHDALQHIEPVADPDTPPE